MNVLFISRLFYPHIGGVERHVLFLSQELISQGHSVTVITEQYDSKLSQSDIYNQIKIIRIPVYKTNEKLKKFLIWKWILAKQSLFQHADVIHVHDVVYWLYPLKLLRPSIKIYTTFHGWEGSYPIPLINILKKRFDAHLSYKNICIGSYITRWYGIKADDISYGAVSKPIKYNEKPNKMPILLYLGRLDQDSSVATCIKIYKKYRHSLNWRMQVIGDGPLRSQLPEEIDYLGSVSNPEKYISSSDYVFTTGYLSILESFVHHKTVFSAFNNPVQKDYITSHPMAKYNQIEDNVTIHGVQEAYNWSVNQTWSKLAMQYLKLWQK